MHIHTTTHTHTHINTHTQRAKKVKSQRNSPWFCGVGTLMKGLVEAKSFWKPLHWESTSKDAGTEQLLAGVTTINGLNRPADTTIRIKQTHHQLQLSLTITKHVHKIRMK